MNRWLVLFDVDGTLIDTAGAGRRAVERAFLEVFGVDAASPRGTVRFGGMTDPAIFLALGRALGVESGTYSERLERLHQVYLGALADEMARHDPRRRVLPGVIELLRALSARDDARMGLITGNLERGARIKLRPFGLNRFFACGGFGSDDPDRAAIARLAWNRAAAHNGEAFDRRRVVVVGDTEHDVACARANGFRSVAVASGWAPRDVLERACPDALLPNLADFSVSLRALGLDERPGCS